MAVSEQIPARQTAARPASAVASPLLVSSPHCPAAVIAAYRTLYTNVDLAIGAGEGRVLIVAAVDDAANAALAAANLAAVGAENGDRTLLVDADLQSAPLGRLFSADTGAGLTQLLRGEHGDLRDVTHSTTSPLLGLITTGADGASPAGRLDRLGDLTTTLLRLKNAADRVLIVTAPVLSSGDAVRLAPHCDGIVLVVAADRTTRANATRARALLDRVKAPLLGVVLLPAATT